MATVAPTTNPDIPVPFCLAFPALCIANEVTGGKVEGTARAAGEAVQQGMAALDPVGQTTQKLYSAVMGPVAEVALTFVLSAAGAALIVWSVISLAGRSQTAQDATRLVGTAVGGAAKAAAV